MTVPQTYARVALLKNDSPSTKAFPLQFPSGNSANANTKKTRAIQTGSTTGAEDKTGRTGAGDSAKDARKLQSLTKAQLIELCEQKQLESHGTKFDMVRRIMSSDRHGGIIQQIRHSAPVIYIHQDDDGHYVHRDTRLVFDRGTSKVTGYKHFDGRVRALSPDDVRMCLKYKFDFQLPENLFRDDEMNIRLHGSCERDRLLLDRLQEIETNEGKSYADDAEEDDDDDENENEEG